MDRAREEATALRGRIGALPGFPLLLACFVVCFAAGVFLDDGPATGIGLGLPVLLLSYAWCRPARRADFAYALLAPAAVSATLNDLIGLPEWPVALPVAMLALIAVWRFDAEQRARLGIERAYGLPRRVRRPRLAR